MANQDEVYEALLEQIKKRVDGANDLQLLRLAEAYAWLVNPSQSHGSTTTVSGS